MPSEIELARIEFEFDCPRCGVDGLSELGIQFKRPFATDSGEYEATGVVECMNCRRPMELEEEKTAEEGISDVNKLETITDALYREHYEGIESHTDVDSDEVDGWNSDI